MRVIRAVAPVVAACLVCLTSLTVAGQQPDGQFSEERVTFQSGGLKIRGVLARPPGEGRFPVYIHTHGSMTAEVASGPPWTQLPPGSHLEALAREGYVVLWVARRGYRGSEGTTQTYSLQRTSGLIPRAEDVFRAAQAEADDLLAAFEYLRTLPFVDSDRISVGGHSVGGLVTILAAAREPRFRAVVCLAGGFRWTEGNNETAWPLVDRAWRESAKKITAPVLILWSKNDFSLEPDVGRELEKDLKKEGHPVQFIVYPAFEDNGHFLFTGPKGFSVFTPDLVRFLNVNLKASSAR